MTLEQAAVLVCNDELYGTDNQQDKLIVLPLAPDDSGGRWCAIIEDWNKQQFVAVYAHPCSDQLLHYLEYNSRESLQSMASHHLNSNNWRVMTRQEFVRFNRGRSK